MIKNNFPTQKPHQTHQKKEKIRIKKIFKNKPVHLYN